MAIITRTSVGWPHPAPECAAPTASAGQGGVASGAAKGFRFPLIHPKPNLQTILVQPDSGKLRFPLKIKVMAGGTWGAHGGCKTQ